MKKKFLSDKGAFKSSLFLFMYFATLPYTLFFMIKSELWQHSYLYNIFLILSYSAIYAFPAFIFSIYFKKLKNFIPTISYKIIISANIMAISLIHLILIMNLKVYKMFGFYFNSFIWNIISTPGGIASLGASFKSFYYLLLIFAFIYLINFLLMIIFFQSLKKYSLNKFCKFFVGFIIILTVIEKCTFALAEFRQNSPILISAAHIPFHLPVTVKSLARKLGYETNNDESISVTHSALLYPKKKLLYEKMEKPFNIIWIVGESLRYDMLNSQYMPDLKSFADNSLNFKKHYSGGNGTRMGMFSMFYGLPGTYWFDFLRESAEPVLIKRLRELEYQFHLSTSARFSYPEFNRTIFSGIEKSKLHEDRSSPGWKRDRILVSKTINFIKTRDTKKPFMTFLFMESPHAPYNFPDEAILEKNYLSEFNYATTNIKKNIKGIFNRYINSCYNFNLETQRILSFLSEQDLMKNTIVIITGDHGEEFMEKGYWGHNSSFVEEQVRTPLIIHIPGIEPKQVFSATSHLDIAPTILKILGLKNSPADLSQGLNLLDKLQPDRKISLSSWHDACLKYDGYKFIFPINNYLKKIKVLDDRDKPLNKKQIPHEELTLCRKIVLNDITSFRKKN